MSGKHMPTLWNESADAPDFIPAESLSGVVGFAEQVVLRDLSRAADFERKVRCRSKRQRAPRVVEVTG